MASSKPSQLALLSDHVKLSLLERQRALSLNLPANSQNAEISRSLDSFREGLDTFEASLTKETNASQASIDQATKLRSQYNELLLQFDSNAVPTSSTLLTPNDSKLASDFARAKQTSTQRPPHSSLKRTPSGGASKSVRFTDAPGEADEEANRAALFPYRDEPDPDDSPDHGHLDNQQIHAYHSQVIRQQDEQLDRLGVSIGRQRELSIQIGDELDDQAHIIDDLDDGVMRHQTQLDRAKGRLGKIARKAKDNWSIVTIASLIIILIFLIIITK